VGHRYARQVSELFGFRIVEVAPPILRVHVETVHPDSHEIHSSKNFALQIIVELYWLMCEGYQFYVPQPIDKVFAAELVLAHPRRAKLERLTEMMHGAEVPITEQEYEQFGEQLRAPHEIGSLKWSSVRFRPEGYFASVGPAYRAFISEAETAIVSVRLENERNHPRKDADDPDAEATLVVKVNDPRLLAHVVTGFDWASAIYDFLSYADLDKTPEGSLQ
jgi:hypothetical protein